ncbi:MAG: hypothetical protein WCG01_03125, partial [bacterium]
AGTYNGSTGQTSCTACAAGTYNGSTGQTSCTACAAGTYTNLTGQSACLACLGNTAATPTTCTACPANTRNNAAHTQCNTYCGNGLFENPNGEGVSEACDGANLNGQTCVSLGYGAGILACQANCTAFNQAACDPCGNGSCEPGETVASCSADCSSCGDGLVTGTEQCDFGANNGTGIGCSATCAASPSFACAANDCCISTSQVASGNWTWVASGLPAAGIVIDFYSDSDIATAKCDNGTLSQCPGACGYPQAGRLTSSSLGNCTTDSNGYCLLPGNQPAGTYLIASPTAGGCSLTFKTVPFNLCYRANGTSYVK